MIEERRDFDAVVVGAGSAGSAAAWMLARAGLKVALVEKRALREAGARWVNGVAPWMLDRAGIERPRPPERRGDHGRTLVLGRDGRVHVTMDETTALRVDMRHLVRRIQTLALDAGVHPHDCVEIVELRLEDGRPVRLVVERNGRGGRAARRLDLGARLFVDASGVAGALRRRVPELDRHCPLVRPEHTCTASQEVRAIRDPAGARTFLLRHGARPGDTLTWPGVDGGFSALLMTVEENLTTVELLAGTTAEPGRATGSGLLSSLREREPWIGKKLFGGGGPIPLRRPYDRLAAPGIALVGDAGCQVVPAHGSGTGFGLMAARLLARSVAGRADPGSLEATWAYQAAFQCELGGRLAAYDVLRRMGQPFSREEIEAMLEAGLIRESTLRAGLEARMPRPEASEMIAVLGAAIREPRLSSRVLPDLVRVAAVTALYRLYPRRPGLALLGVWSRVVARVFREIPDVTPGRG